VALDGRLQPVEGRVSVDVGLSGSILGVEGSMGTSVSFVTLADGRRGLTVWRTWGGGGDCDCDGEVTSVATVAHGKLQPQGEFATGEPCDCQYCGE
jgi:hypothetical protein